MKYAEKVVLSVKNYEGICILITELLTAMETVELRLGYIYYVIVDYVIVYHCLFMQYLIHFYYII